MWAGSRGLGNRALEENSGRFAGGWPMGNGQIGIEGDRPPSLADHCALRHGATGRFAHMIRSTRILSLALLLSIAGEAATIMPVVTASTPAFSINGGSGQEFDDNFAAVLMGPGGGTLNFTTLEAGTGSLGVPGQEAKLMGVDIAQIGGSFSEKFIGLDYEAVQSNCNRP
jgi:hypothetical protein